MTANKRRWDQIKPDFTVELEGTPVIPSGISKICIEIVCVAKDYK